ncbi:carbohydrate kinase family protein [Streptomyces specialis]|uniref:carbohydrate kinase family protein n=1 Tax=Streptomyces specialis TaxID=498367 RepID=UPI002D21B703|nr:PfkB family carbohydrate kinase [Streptomyces specialis]
MDYDVLVVGGAGVDTIVRVERLEVPDLDVLHVPPIRDYAAHTGTGAALGFHALGRRVKFIDFLGDDPQGDVVRARFRGAGLDFETLPAPNGTPRSVNLVDAEGRRFSFYDGRHPDGLLMPPDFAPPRAARARHVHVSRARVNRALLAELARRDVPVSTDLHAWDGENPDTRPWAFGADYVFLSAAAVRGRVDEVLRTILAGGRARLAVATDGADGCHVLARGDEAGVRRYRAVTPPDPVVDSNGAGDAFVTAFLHTWLGGGPDLLDRSVLAGLVSGAFACTVHGTHERHITAAELAAAVRALRTPDPADRAGWRWS